MKKLKGKCAVFLDIDGTLTYHNPIPSDKVIDTLRRAQQAGHKILLNTGRGYGNIYQPMLEVVKPDGVICAMGQYIELEGKVIRKVTISEKMKKCALELAKEKALGGFIEGISKIYSVTYGSIEPWKADLSTLEKADEAPVEDMLKICYVGQADKKTLEILEDYFTIYQHKDYFESAIKGYTKAQGMLYAADLLGITVSNCIAVGDSTNDAEMIKAAGVGVAMGNATEELKAIADIVTESNAHDGVAVILEQLLEM